MTPALGAAGATRTARLVLAPVASSDLAELHRLHADPRVWAHLPGGRHTSERSTAEMIGRMVRGWQVHGLDVWTARDAAGRLAGLGGADLRRGTAWNLGYRLVPESWGQGLAQEVVGAARERAAALRPELPVVAFLLEHNLRSRAAAERAGLEPVWRGPDVGNPDPAAVRLVHADRPVDEAVLRPFVGGALSGGSRSAAPRR